LLIVVALAVGRPALGQELFEGQKAEERSPDHQGNWSSSLEGTDLPAAAVRQGESVALGELKAGFERRFPAGTHVELTTGMRYGATWLDASASLSLPDSLQHISVPLGAQCRFSDQWIATVEASPGITGDFREIHSRDLRVPVMGHIRYQAGPNLGVMLGAAYTGTEHLPSLVPVVGVWYQPQQQWLISLGAPVTGIRYFTAGGTQFFLEGQINATEYRLHDPSLGARVLTYRDLRSLAGVEIPLAPALKLALSGGYAGWRRFKFYEENRPDLGVEGTFVGRAALLLAW